MPKEPIIFRSPKIRQPGLQSRTSPRALEKTRDRTACRYSALFSLAQTFGEASQTTGYFLCFVGDSVKFLCRRDWLVALTGIEPVFED
jgi:hypothetical protein